MEIKKAAKIPEEKEELWNLVEEIVHHHVMIIILEKLPEEHHIDFMEKFRLQPFNTEIIEYLNQKSGTDIEEMLKSRMRSLEKEILKEIRGK